MKINRSTTMLIAMCACAAIFVSCAKPAAGPEVIWVVGSVEVKSAAGSTRAAAASEILAQGDTVTTGAESHITIQFSPDIIAKVEENSTLALASLTAQKGLTLQKGQILSKVAKLGKDESYTVTTPTAVAGVRGTEFSVKTGDAGVAIAVKDGKILVTDPVRKIEKTAETGKTVVLQKGRELEVRPISKIETLEIEKVSVIVPIPGMGAKSDKDIKAIQEKLRAKEAEIDTQIRKEKGEKDDDGPMTLEQIKAKYGRIESISLYDGMVYKGAVISRGDMVSIATTTGVVKVPAQKIKRVDSVQ
jgi:hypothetical protein